MLQAVIFDLDGTLLNSINDIRVHVNTVLKKYGFSPYETTGLKECVGYGSYELIKRTSGSTDEVLLKKMTQEFEDLYLNSSQEYSKAYDGIFDLLSALEERGIRKSILSNKPHHLTVACRDLFFSDYGFDEVLGVTEMELKKPSPALALKIAERYNLEPSRIAFVGDTKIDMITAKNAGMYPIGVTWGFRSVEELKENGAGKIISNPQELLELF